MTSFGTPLRSDTLAILVDSGPVRQTFNDTRTTTPSGSWSALWRKRADTLEMTPEQLTGLYPDGPKALSGELA